MGKAAACVRAISLARFDFCARPLCAPCSFTPTHDPTFFPSFLPSPFIMFAARSVARKATPLLARTYAEAAPATSNKLKLSFGVPHQVSFVRCRPNPRLALSRTIHRSLHSSSAQLTDDLCLSSSQALFSSAEVEQVNIPGESGMMGILSGHVPTLEALKPGVLEVIESGNNSKKWFSEFLLFSSLFAWVGLWKKGSERGGKEGRLDCDAWLEMPCWIALAPWPPCMPALVNCPDQRVLCVPQSLPDSLPSTPTTPSPSTPLRLTISPSSTLPFVPSHTLLSAFPPFLLTLT